MMYNPSVCERRKGTREAEGKKSEAKRNKSSVCIRNHVYDIMVVIVSGSHLFPFRTEKLSPSAPMVLRIAGE